MFDKFKKKLEIKKIILDIHNYYEKLGWQLDKYFVLKIRPSKNPYIQNKHESEYMKKSIKILYLLNEYIKKIPTKLKNIHEVIEQIKEIELIKIDEKNINIDLIAKLLARYYVLAPYIYVCVISSEYIKNETISVKKILNRLTKKDLVRITLKSPIIINIWKNICNEPELIKKFDPEFTKIFDMYIQIN